MCKVRRLLSQVPSGCALKPGKCYVKCDEMWRDEEDEEEVVMRR
jgi:hypothetical protein